MTTARTADPRPALTVGTCVACGGVTDVRLPNLGEPRTEPHPDRRAPVCAGSGQPPRGILL